MGSLNFFKHLKNILHLLVVFLILSMGCQQAVDNGEALFSRLRSSRTGIDFNNRLTETHEMNVIIYQDFYSGGGVAIGDVNMDGWPDVFFTGNMVPARLYLNKGDLRFEDITEQAGLSNMPGGWHTGTTMVDINNDGYLDIFIGRSGLEEPEDRTNLLYINQGDGTFLERGADYRIDDPGYAVNATFFDYDRDGDLDMYLVNQGPEKYEGGDASVMRNERHRFAGDKLFENIGERFVDVTLEAGIYSAIIGFAHGVSAGDINNDGWEDLFVSNDFFEHDYIYLNNGDKTFREVVKTATKHISYYSMGNDMADYNNDGLLDIVVLDMVAEDNRRLKENLGGMKKDRFELALRLGYHHQYMLNVLHLNHGDGTFSDVGQLAGIATTDWSWAPLFADFDNDGWKDLYVSNGIRKDIRNIDWGERFHATRRQYGGKTEFTSDEWDMLLEAMPSKAVPNYIYRNNGDLTFSKKIRDWGLDHPSFSNGAAYGDLDRDGDLDLVVNNIDDEAFVFENHAADSMGSHFLRISLTGPENNRMALGTKVEIFHGDEYQYQQHYLTRGYRSSMEPVMHFGLGADTIVKRIRITWPNREVTILEDVAGDQVIDIVFKEAERAYAEESPSSDPFFRDITRQTGIDFRHKENAMDDYLREPLLPYQLSMLGPPLAVADVNGDGMDDFYVGGAFRYPGALYVQNPDGTFRSLGEDLWQQERLFEDMGALFLDYDLDGDQDLYVVSGGNEFTDGTAGLQDRLYRNEGRGNFVRDKKALPDILISGSRVKAEDFDRDGDPDLFVGGRMLPGKYPLPADSRILMNEEGRFRDVTSEIAPELQGIGLVTDAVWADMEGDGDTDLILAGEWMPIILMENRDGRFHRINNENNGLEHSSGWWFSLAAHDFDSDGDPDLVAGNLGLNYRYKASKEAPFELFYTDYDRNGQHEIILGYWQEGNLYPVSDRLNLVTAIPALADRFPENDPFSVATLQEIMGDNILEEARHEQAYSFATSYIENLGNGRFRIRPFENLAQLSAVNAILVDDVDGDDLADILMAGNLYASEKETIRYDAGIGTFLKGDGTGHFTALPYARTGLYADGDVKDMKMIGIRDRRAILLSKNSDSLQVIRIIPSQPE